MPEPFEKSQRWETSWSMSSWGWAVTTGFQVPLIDTKISQGDTNLDYSKYRRCNFHSWQSPAESDSPGAPRLQTATASGFAFVPQKLRDFTVRRD